MVNDTLEDDLMKPSLIKCKPLLSVSEWIEVVLPEVRKELEITCSHIEQDLKELCEKYAKE